MKKIAEFIKENLLVFDGGTGTLLQAAGLPLGELPERWNVSHTDVVQGIHRAYFDAGSNVVCTNTFGANVLKFSETELEKVVASAVENARKARAESKNQAEKYIALDIGPSGKLLKPYGDLDFEDAVECFAKTVRLGVKYGVDLIFIETMSDCYETKAAVLAAKENCDLPVIVSNAYGEDGKLMTGATPAAMVALLEGLGVDGIGVNCSYGPKGLRPVVEELLQKSSLPILVKPNAGLPQSEGGKTYYDVDETEFAEDMAEFVRMGARMVGGCCGTTPAYIAETVKRVKDLPVLPVTEKEISCVSSYTHAVEFDKPLWIGERINPTGKKRLKQALLDGETDYVLNEGIAQWEKGAHILDVNVGLPELDEKTALVSYVEKLQAVIPLPLQIDTSDCEAMEKAMRRYNGKPLVNSVNGKKESMEKVFPLVKKYGGMVVALTLDENGIPENAEGRVAITAKILETAEKYGIKKKDILFDPLALTVSADKNAAKVTLQALKQIKDKFGAHTSLGVSNVSFGLPARENINATFYALALENGLSAAILNPNSEEMKKVYRSFLALKGLDENCAEYIRFAQAGAETKLAPAKTETTLKDAIVKGLESEAERLCEERLKTSSPLQIISEEIVPALDEVGKAYEEKRAFLPQLLISAESAKKAFEKIRLAILQTGEKSTKKCKIVLATVQGDIHDIGKNIVKTLLENYAFDVIDLGKDVSPEKIVETAVSENAPLIGLSALMTTTVPSMEETIRKLKKALPDCKIVVGGAVLTKEYAEKIGADRYAKDGMETVRYAEEIYADLYKN